MEPYVVKESNLSALARSHNAFYQETCIINSCLDEIVIVEVTGEQRIIKPIGTMFANQTVVIHRRETEGASLAANGNPIQIPGISVEIPYYKIKNGPIFVEELNAVICTKEDAETCRHPHAAMEYHEALDNGLQVMTDHIKDAPGVKLLANDPTASCDHLYTVVDTRLVTIPVTHLSAEKFTLTIIVIDEGKYYTEIIELDDLLSGTANTLEFSNRFIPFVTTSRANAEATMKTFKWLNPTTFAEMKEKMQKQYEAELALKELAFNSQKAEMEAKAKDLATKLAILNTTLSQVTAERDDFKYKYQYLKGDINATNEMMTAFSNRKKYESSVQISDDDVEISHTKRQHTKEEATFKTWHLILAAAIPVICALGIEYFRSRR